MEQKPELENMIYLDNAATTPIFEECLKIIEKGYKNWANPNAVYCIAKAQKKKLEESRKKIIKHLNIDEKYITIFTSCSSESNSLILNNFDTIFCFNFEHSSIKNHPKSISCTNLEEEIQKHKQLHPEKKHLISASLIQPETGLILNVEDIKNLANKYSCKLHLDASQAKSIDCTKLDADYYTISSHKLGGPVGVAACISKSLLTPIIYGGSQEYNMKAGTQNTPLIEAFAEAIEINAKNEGFGAHFKRLKEELFKLDTNFLEKNDKKLIPEFYESFCDHIICILTNFPSSELVAFMDMNNIAIANGSACKQGQEVIGLLKNQQAIRISLGWKNCEYDIAEFVRKFKEFVG